jgi:hypothetical protein
MKPVHLPADSKHCAPRHLVLLAAVPLLVLALTAVACGGSGQTAYWTVEDDVVLQFSTAGGFAAVDYNLTRLPQFTLYGDGTVIVEGPMIAIYPAPALPNLQTTKISGEGIGRILSAADEAGLLANDVDYGRPDVTDIPDTVVTVRTGGKTYLSTIYASGAEEVAGGLTAEQKQARAVITAFSLQLSDLSAFQSGEIKWVPYTYSALAVFSTPVDPSTAPDSTEVQPNRLDWPLDDLATSGQTVLPDGYRKVVVSGEDLAKLKPLLSQATQITLWKSGDTEYHLSLRPLLPGEAD